MLNALVFGLVQGLSEFLPISSSGHLALAMHLLDWQEPPMLMELVVHLGTLAAVLAFYGRDLLAAIAGGLRLLASVFRGTARRTWAEDQGARLAVWVALATVPTGVVALLVKDRAEHAMASPATVGVLMVVTGVLLLASRWVPQRDRPLDAPRALLVGLVQGLAVFPGVSRSGTTIVAGLAFGLSRAEAARFSFLASIPAILGASALELDPSAIAASGSGASYLLAGLVAAVSGYAALGVLVGLVGRGALWMFAFYMVPLGTVVALSLR